MNNKALAKIVKTVIPSQGVLPILEDVCISKGKLTICDLETFVEITFYQRNIHACIPAKKFLEIMALMGEPVMREIIIKGGPPANNADKKNIEFTQNNRKVSVYSESPDNYPVTPKFKSDPIGHLDAVKLGLLAQALQFTSDDDLRPAMTGVFVHKDIAATDADSLAWYKNAGGLDIPVIIPYNTVKTLLAIGLEKDEFWTVYSDSKLIMFDNMKNGIQVTARLIDARFPDYKVVIPKTKDAQGILTWKVEAMRDEFKTAMMFSNSVTNQVEVDLKTILKVKAEDIDMENTYLNLPQGYHLTVKDPVKGINVAFSGKFMDKILSNVPKGTDVKMFFFGNSKAIIINGCYLLMPLIRAEDIAAAKLAK